MFNNLVVPQRIEEHIYCKVAELTINYQYTQEQIDAYLSKCLSYFWGIGGNIPYSQFKKDHGSNPKSSANISLNERYYISEQPYALCGEKIKAGYSYDKEKLNEIKLITGLNLVSLSTRNVVTVDIRHFVRNIIDVNYKGHTPSGMVNLHLIDAIRKAVPYLTLREVLQEAVSFIGKRHIYFTQEIIDGFLYADLTYPTKRVILNCHFAEYVCENSH